MLLYSSQTKNLLIEQARYTRALVEHTNRHYVRPKRVTVNLDCLTSALGGEVTGSSESFSLGAGEAFGSMEHHLPKSIQSESKPTEPFRTTKPNPARPWSAQLPHHLLTHAPATTTICGQICVQMVYILPRSMVSLVLIHVYIYRYTYTHVHVYRYIDI